MPTTEQLRQKLINKLKELFQLNQPDLDFGFYRIMHAKAEQVSSFIENDLLQVIQETFGQVDETRKAQLKEAIDKEIQAAKDYGVSDPENSPKVMEARAKYEAVKDSASSEAEIYDHLYRFFERYYDDGDFISRRYYTRETPGKAAPFSIPYNGEEVKLHWANADQYYIKTTEYFTNYTVNLPEAVKSLKETKKFTDEEIDFGDNSVTEGLKIHFRIIEATEGEHGNIKASEKEKRFFIIHKESPVEISDKGELIVNFEYRPDPEKQQAKENNWRETRNKEAVEIILQSLKDDSKTSDYLDTLSTPAPTEGDKGRTLLAKLIHQYTARNTMDYFIHKNLGAFLKRELDFYIKNEIMRLDDIENAEVPKVEDYLAKIKVLRKIAIKLIDFMAQLEDFQKKLWLKKKFVVETNYCITLDRVPEELYLQIIANKEQIDEWIKLYAIDEIEGDTTCPAYTNPLSLNFLKVNNKLMLDTRFFDEVFKDKLLSSIQYFDDQCDGLLIHSENFQALNLIRESYWGTLDGIYGDPPYNTSASEIAYKNSFKHSSWLSFLENRVICAKQLLHKNGISCYTIDDFELNGFRQLLESIYSDDQFLGQCVIRNNPSGRSTVDGLSIAHEYALFYGNSDDASLGRLDRNAEQLARYQEIDSLGNFEWVNFRKHGGTRSESPKMFYPIVLSNESFRIPDMIWDDSKNEWIMTGDLEDGEIIIYPKDASGQERRWKWSVERLKISPSECKIDLDREKKPALYIKSRMNDEGTLPLTWWDKKEYSATAYGTNLLKNMFLSLAVFPYPKSIYAVMDSVKVVSNSKNAVILDYFAGSGTTGHAVINLNREDKENGKRKFILIEMGDYFDNVLKPRISKAVYSDDWKDGKPKNRHTGISHCFKYLRLESYEDTLNNLVLQGEPIRDKTIAGNASLQEDYLLHYMLDVESKGSQSLLNIDAFNDPTSYVLKVKKPGSDEYIEKAVDLIETFNYLIGLRLVHLGIPQTLSADFTRMPDSDLPQDQDTKLVIAGNGKLKTDQNGKWWIRKVEGWVPKNPYSPNDGLREKVLIVWRKLTGNFEEDNLILDSWFQKNRISTLDWEFDTIYVNGSNNLPNLQKDGDTWKVRLIEEEFMKRMWEQ